MFKKIAYLVMLVVLSCFAIQNVRVCMLENLIYPPLYSMAAKNNNYMMYLKCGEVKLMAGRYDEAENIFKMIITNAKAASLTRERNLAFLYLGNTYYTQQKYDEALSAYAVVLKNEPANKKALKRFARIKMAYGEYASLYPYVVEYIKIKPQDSFGHTERCAILARYNKFHHARESCETAINLNKHDARAFYDYGDLYLGMRQEKLAEEYHKKAKLLKKRIKSRAELEQVIIDAKNNKK